MEEIGTYILNIPSSMSSYLILLCSLLMHEWGILLHVNVDMIHLIMCINTIIESKLVTLPGLACASGMVMAKVLASAREVFLPRALPLPPLNYDPLEDSDPYAYPLLGHSLIKCPICPQL